jgi:hypothetical protein
MSDEQAVPQGSQSEPDGGIQRILERLVPEAGAQVQFRDLTGGLHRSPAVRPLRVQAEMASHVRDIIARVGEIDLNLAGILAALTDPEALRSFVALFELLHPRAVERARGHVAELPQDDERRDMFPSDGPIGAQDLFAVEELADAVLPFFAVVALRLVRLGS